MRTSPGKLPGMANRAGGSDSMVTGNTAYQRLGVTAQLLAEAKLSFQLAQARYRLGLSSIVELSRA